MVDLNDLAQTIHNWARGKGFYDREHLEVKSPFAGHHTPEYLENPSMPSEKVALMHEECSELLRALREGDPEGESEECADIMIRVLDYCAWRGIDIEHHIVEKMKKNLDRPHLHGHKF